MKILLNYQSMISIGIVSKIMMFLLLDAIIGKKEKRKGMALLRNKRQMERYYRHAAKHMQDMEAGWNFLGGGVARKGIFGRMMREYALRTEAQCRILLNRWRNICIDKKNNMKR